VIREIPRQHEFIRSDQEGHYAAIREQLGRPPDLERLRRGDAATQREIAEQKANEQAGLGHAFAEHRVEKEQLQRRALDGTKARCPEAGPNPDQVPEHATGFKCDEAIVAAAAVGWASPETTRQRLLAERRLNRRRAAGMSDQELARLTSKTAIVHFGPAERALGSNWRSYVEGYSRQSGGRDESYFGPDTRVQTVWRMSPEGKWYVETCFPRP
jgi:hypothetical protein